MTFVCIMDSYNKVDHEFYIQEHKCRILKQLIAKKLILILRFSNIFLIVFFKDHLFNYSCQLSANSTTPVTFPPLFEFSFFYLSPSIQQEPVTSIKNVNFDLPHEMQQHQIDFQSEEG